MIPEDIHRLVPLYVSGSLPAEDKSRLEAELVHSRELRDEVEFWKYTLAAVKTHQSQTGEAHLPPENLLGFLEGSLPQDVLAKVREHLSSCSECTTDLQIIQELHREVSLESTEDKQTRTKQTALLPNSRSWRIGYLVAAAAALVVFIFLQDFDSSRDPEIAKRFDLFYSTDLRSPDVEKEIPSLRLKEFGTLVEFRIRIPQSGLDGVSYSVRLLSPFGPETLVADSLIAVGGDERFDILVATVDTGMLTISESPYEIIVNEILPASFDDLTPEQYRYRFTTR